MEAVEDKVGAYDETARMVTAVSRACLNEAFRGSSSCWGLCKEAPDPNNISPPPPLPPAQVTATNVDIARVAPKWHLYTPEEVEEVITRL